MKNIISFFQSKKNQYPISVVTCYDASFASLIQKTDIECILVGDSLGMVIQGQNSTMPVSLDEMIYHTKAVRRGAAEKFIVIDLPFLSYQVSLEEGVRSAGRAMRESGADAVKLEGGDSSTIQLVQRLVEIGIPVMGHLGLTPQSYQTLGGYKVQGKDPESAEAILKSSIQLEKAGAFSIVLEMVPESLGKLVSGEVKIPTIGIGAGRYTDGQVLVLYDLLGLNDEFSPKFLKKYANFAQDTKSALQSYHSEVVGKQFPTEDRVFL